MDYKTHHKSNRHKRIESQYNRVIDVGIYALCSRHKTEQWLTDNTDDVTCIKCLRKLSEQNRGT